MERTCTRALGAALLALACLAGPARAQEAADASWQPEKTYALLIGTLEWKSKELATFPKEGRKDRALERQLQADGVPKGNVVFLEDGEATREAALREVAAIARRAGEGSTLIVYYAGHGLRRGDDVFFASWDANPSRPDETAIPLAEVGKILRSSWKGRRLLLLADCCHSGALGTIVDRFAGEGPPFAASLTSATASNISTGAWTFTESLLDAFSGDGTVDADGDGAITLAETEGYVRDAMRFKESQLSGSRETSGFSPGFVLRRVDPARARKAAAGPWRVGDYAECVWEDGKWYRAQIIDARGEERRVRYLGFEAKWDEWVGPKRLRAPQSLAAKEGEKVEVEWGKKWWPARIVKVEGDFALVHYDNYGKEWDEWVGAKRMRKK